MDRAAARRCDVTFTGLAIAFVLTCAVLGLRRSGRTAPKLLAASLAAAMVCAQLALLLTR